ncbi:MAG: hypothetical protein OXC57_09510, partial [Rhodobacteraceae bacterium]|nr:hypothetical protein [Paracoccaceae bacterium]
DLALFGENSNYFVKLDVDNMERFQRSMVSSGMWTGKVLCYMSPSKYIEISESHQKGRRSKKYYT